MKLVKLKNKFNSFILQILTYPCNCFANGLPIAVDSANGVLIFDELGEKFKNLRLEFIFLRF